MRDNEKYVKIGEAADYVGVTTQTLRNYGKRGILVPALTRDSGHRLYSISQLDKFIEEKFKV